MMPCQRARARAKAELSAKEGTSPADQTEEKSQFSFCPITIMTIMAAQRCSALTEARNAHKQKLASEGRASAFSQHIVTKLGEIKQTLHDA
jgi:hypothetical protein